jgi:hypothetical protein
MARSARGARRDVPSQRGKRLLGEQAVAYVAAPASLPRELSAAARRLPGERT